MTRRDSAYQFSAIRPSIDAALLNCQEQCPVHKSLAGGQVYGKPASLAAEKGSGAILFGTIVAQRESLLWDTAKRLNNIAQGREAHRRVHDQNQESTPKGLYKTVADD